MDLSEKIYKYQTSGLEIKIGDKVRYEGFGVGKVLKILQPGSEEAKGWNLPHGAVLLGFKGEGVDLALEDTEDDEDLDFIERAKDNCI